MKRTEHLWRVALALALALALLLGTFALAEQAPNEAELGELEVYAEQAETPVPEDQEVNLGAPAEIDGEVEFQADGVSVKLGKTGVTLGVKETFAIPYTVTPAKSASLVRFKSLKTSVAAVNAKTGKVAAKKVGTAYINVLVSGKKIASFKVVVKKAPARVTMSRSKATIKAGTALQLTAKLPSGTASALKWSTSNKKVATVSAYGLVKGVKAGTATITARTYNGKTTSCKVTVKKAVTVKLDRTRLTLARGDTFRLTATTSAATTLEWWSDNWMVADVDEYGVVTAWEEGVAKIWVATADGMLACCVVTVEDGGATVSLDYTKLTMNVGDSFRLTATASAATTLEWWSDDLTVADVNEGLVSAVGEGATKIWVATADGNTASCAVTVEGGGAAVSLDRTSLSLKVGESFLLTATPDDGKLEWWSTAPSVASVADGLVSAVGEGTATVWVMNGDGQSASCKVTVTAASVVTVSLNVSQLRLDVGDTYQLVATTSGWTSVTWSSSDSSVATVQAGLVKGVKAGAATVTVTTADGTSASCEVTVEGRDDRVTYRALLVGEEAFSPVCSRNRGDVGLMAGMLASVKGPAGGSYSVTKKYDLSKSGVLSAIKTTFAGADEDDVSLFFIATHGDVDTSGSTAGALAMIPQGYMLMGELADALKVVPGRVIVVLESCGSGAGVYANGASANELRSAFQKSARAFDAAAVEAFSRRDGGVYVNESGKTVGEKEVWSNTGEFRVANKFYVLTASRYQELSWGTESTWFGGPYNYFTRWLTQGVGTVGAMPADTNGDGRATLEELYRYVQKVGDNYSFDDGTGVYYQHVQVYPASSGYELFKR